MLTDYFFSEGVSPVPKPKHPCPALLAMPHKEGEVP